MKKSLLLMAMVLYCAGTVLAQNNPTNPPAFQCGGTVSDYDGNIYTTVEMAGFCWMQENLRVTHYVGGTFIPNASIYHYGSLNDQESNLNTYGRLYTWYSAVNVPENSAVSPLADADGYVRGACPQGWHIPTEAEMSALRALNAESLRSVQLWLHPEYNTNSTGFTALPAGQYTAANERYEYLLARTGFWSVDGGTLIGSDMDATQLVYNCDAPQVAPFSKSDALSVRCVYDGNYSTTVTTPAITTASTVSGVTPASATVSSTVTSDGGAAVTSRGVCWGTGHNPTLSGGHTSDGAGTGAFNSSLTGLTPNTTYYVRPYATNSEGTTYGSEISFTTPCNAVTVTITGETSICAGESTSLTAMGAENYVWNTTPATNGSTLSVNAGGTYKVTGTDQYGCMGTASKTVTVTNCATTPAITTASTVSGLTPVSATVNSTVTSDGGAAVTSRGVCWGTGHNPTLSGGHTSDGAGTGAFNSSLTGLTPNTTYYVRPYATNSEGTTYGSEISFTTPCNAVTVTITGETSICAGESTSLTATGAESYVWNTTPATSGNTLSVNAGGIYEVTGTDQYGCTGTASKTVTVHIPQHGSETVSLCPTDLPYSWHGEICNGEGDYTYPHSNGYGCTEVDTLHLVIANCAEAPTVTVTVDEDEDVEPTSATLTGVVTDDGGAPVTSYGFCWGTEEDPDLTGEHTTYTAGEEGFSGTFTGTLTGLHPNTLYYVRSYATNSAGTSYGFGVWFRTPCWTVTVSISGESDICAGSSTVLEGIGADSYNWRRGTNTSTIISTEPTITVSTGGTYIVTGFDAYHCPGHFSKTVTVHTPQHGSQSVSVCENELPYTWHGVECNAAGHYTYPHVNAYGCEEVDTLHLTVRNCVMPTVSTESVTDVTSTSAKLNGAISNPDNMTITSQGFEWKATVGGTYTQVYVEGTTMSYILTSLTESTGYTFRAFVTTNSGTIYGEERNFSTTSPIIAPVACEVPVSHAAQTSNVFEGNGFNGANHGLETVTNDGKINSVTDYDGNEYPVVQVGSQCWLAENMRCTHSPRTGTYIVNNEFTTGKKVAYTHTGKMARWYNNDSTTYAATHYGLLYNWNAAVDVYNTTYGELSINTNSNYALSTTFTGTCQGICPVGWHVPTDAEWTTMTNYVSSNIDNRCDNNNTYIAKTLVSTTGWDTSTVACAIGNIPESNNAMGFSAFPASCFIGEFYAIGKDAYFWTSSQNQSSKYMAWYRSLNYNYADVSRINGSKYSGYSVRCLRDQIGAAVPTVTTTDPSEITTTSVRLHGSYSNPSNVDIIAKGFQWKTTTSGAYMQTTVSGETETLGYVLTGLTANTSYTYRAFVTSAFGNTYGSEMTFVTDSIPAPVISTYPCNVTSTHPAQTGSNYQDNGFNGANHGLETVTSEGKINSVTDYDGNEYPVVQIGGQCWLAQNMRCTHSPKTGTYIVSNSTSGSFSGKMAKWYDNDELTCVAKKYGALYNWNAAFDTFNTSFAYETSVSTSSNDAFSVDFLGVRQGICPVGWHLPTDAEWTALENTMYGGNVNNLTSDYRGSCAGRLSDGEDWIISSNANSPGDYSNSNRNSSAFGAVPAGEYVISYTENGRVGSYQRSGQYTFFWSSSQKSDDAAFYRELYYDAKGVRRYFSLKYHALSVRCLRDEIGGEHGLSAPSVTTSAIDNNNVTAVSAKCEGSIISDGGTTVLAYGVCWNTTGEPTNTGNNQTYQGNTVDFSFMLNGLEANTTYYVRAFAINAVGIGYGEERSFTTGGQPCPGVTSVRDYDGNVYYTVKIGEQCWMRENLHASHFADGSIIGVGSSSSNTIARGYYPNNQSYNAYEYGLLYNWDAVIHSADGDMSGSSFVQGVCPKGWHVPSDGEWMQLTDYVMSQNSYSCGSDNTNIAKALAYTSGWNSYSGTCYVGNSQTNNNATGFSARPAGRYNGSSYVGFGQSAIFWSSTGSSGTASVTRSIYYGSSTVDRSESNMSGGCFSVRCLCDDPSCDGMTESLIIETKEVSNVTASTATIRSMISSDGGYEIYESGVCWSTAHNPTVEDRITYDGMGTGEFISYISGLSPATTYYVRPFLMNDLGTAYGNEVSFTTCGTQFVTVSDAAPVHVGESVTLTANGALEYRWSTGETTQSIVVIPSTNRHYSVVGVDQNGCKDSVSIALKIIVPEGDAQPCPSTPTVTDNDDNTYTTVQIGTQCWMAQNLRTKRFPDGSSIYLGGNNSSSNSIAYYYNYSASSIPLYSRGYLYNWSAVMNGASSSNNIPSGVQGICPNGWHLPSDSEWMILSNYVSGKSEYRCGNASSNIAKALASETGWSSSSNGECSVGNLNQHVNNLTGFDAFPTGIRRGSSFYSSDYYAYFWSSSQDEDDNSEAWFRSISSTNANLNRSSTLREYGLAVRCLRNEISASTSAATSISQTTATLNGSITNPDNVPITAQGFEWKVADSSTYTVLPVSGMTMSSDLTALIPNTKYTYHLFFTTADGTYYGNECEFITADTPKLSPCIPPVSHPAQTGAAYHGHGFNGANHGLESVNDDGHVLSITDYDGNEYPVVQIGNQCWMAVNMRSTRYSDGTSVPFGGSEWGISNPYYYDNVSSSYVLQLRGYYYNWPAAMHRTSSSDNYSSNSQGICPTGWHIPSRGEWESLVTQTRQQSEYYCSDTYSSTGKALASVTGWNLSTQTCAVGNSPENNNATGFAAIPVGYYNAPSFYAEGNFAVFWTSTTVQYQGTSENVWRFDLEYNEPDASMGSGANHQLGRSVRCLRD